jgi:hypothetical protein
MPGYPHLPPHTRWQSTCVTLTAGCSPATLGSELKLRARRPGDTLWANRLTKMRFRRHPATISQRL